MKINILTQPLFCNYGGILQNYALQTILRRLGHEPLTVNVPTPPPGAPVKWKDAVKTGLNLFKHLTGRYQYPFLSPYRLACKEHELSFPQRAFVEKNISKTDHKAPFTSDICAEYPADAWIVGSDQVWRQWCSPYLENCFLDFVPDDTVKIAYAASFGVDNWEISQATTERLKKLASRMSAVSVREISGVGLCREHLGVDAIHVLDPTMLLSASDYLGLTTAEDAPAGDYIATYVLDINGSKADTIRTFARAWNLPIHKVGQMHRDSFDSIGSWIAGIANARYVITDSFHGTVFSILFGRPVMILGNHTRGNARIDSLISTLGFKKSDDGFYRPDKQTEETIGRQRELSLDFLKKSLS